MEDFAPSMGAALSYYTTFSLAPLLVILVAVAGLVFGEDAAQGRIVAELRDLMGKEGAVAVEALLKSASDPAESSIAAAVGFITLLIGATSVFGELQSSLDRIWRAPAAAKKGGLRALFRERLLSFAMILGLGFLLIASLAFSAALAVMGSWWGESFAAWELALQAINFVVSFGVTTLLFAMIYKILPRVRIGWGDVWIGAAITALLFTIGKLLIGLYLGKSAVSSAFGAASSIVVVLLWVYYSAQIFLFGAEFTWVYAYREGSRAGVAAPPPTPAIPSKTGMMQAASGGSAAAARTAASKESMPAPGAQAGDHGVRARMRLWERKPAWSLAIVAAASLGAGVLTRMGRGRRTDQDEL